MKLGFLIIALTGLFFPYISNADILSGDVEATMCSRHEEIYFSCPVGKKIVSVCASGNISPDQGYVQYRIGLPGKPEMENPAKPYPPKNRFSLSEMDGGSLNSVHLKFNSAGYNYVVYQSATSGVYVKKNGKTIANLTCGDSSYQQISPKARRGIQLVDPEDNID